MNTSKSSKLYLLLKLICAGFFIGGCTGAALLLAGVFQDPITELFCSLAGAVILPTVVNFVLETRRLAQEAIAKDQKEECSVEIGAQLVAFLDETSNEMRFLDTEFERWIAERSQPNGQICRSGVVVELWACAEEFPACEVHARISRGRSARWLGTFSDTQIVAILAE
ncbi:MAG: hypothetical protein U0103_17120 [Candidatus Obscuribacterales bacterium]|nr:MAG: hypothetical protein EKK48_17415 [Candidatus Melainabacteria bacterium]